MLFVVDPLSLSSKEGGKKKGKGKDLLHALHTLTKQCEISIIGISLLDMSCVVIKEWRLWIPTNLHTCECITKTSFFN